MILKTFLAFLLLNIFKQNEKFVKLYDFLVVIALKISNKLL